jgi:hypothetical protein
MASGGLIRGVAGVRVQSLALRMQDEFDGVSVMDE